MFNSFFDFFQCDGIPRAESIKYVFVWQRFAPRSDRSEKVRLSAEQDERPIDFLNDLAIHFELAFGWRHLDEPPAYPRAAIADVSPAAQIYRRVRPIAVVA